MCRYVGVGRYLGSSWSQRKVIDGRPTLPHPSLSALTFWLSAFSGIPLEKKSALGLRFEGNELWASTRVP